MRTESHHLLAKHGGALDDGVGGGMFEIHENGRLVVDAVERTDLLHPESERLDRVLDPVDVEQVRGKQRDSGTRDRSRLGDPPRKMRTPRIIPEHSR